MPEELARSADSWAPAQWVWFSRFRIGLGKSYQEFHFPDWFRWSEGEALTRGRGWEARLLEQLAPGLPLASVEVRVQRSLPKGVKPRVSTQGQVASPVLTCLPCKGEGSYRRLLQGRRCKCHLPGMVSKYSFPFFVHNASQRTGGDTCRHSLGGREGR